MKDEDLFVGLGTGLSLALCDWPAEDRERLRVARDPLFANRRRLGHAPIENSSWTMYAWNYALVLGVLREILPDRLLLATADRLDRETVLRVVDHLLASSRWRHNGIHNVLHGARLLLRRLDPALDLTWLHEIQKHFYVTRELRDISDNFQRTGALVRFGQELIEQARGELVSARRRPERVRAALLFRDGLMIVFLALVPLRRANLVDLRLGVDFLLQTPMKIAIASESEKTDQVDWRELPVEITEPMGEYFREDGPGDDGPRKILALQHRGQGDQAHLDADCLWLSRTGRKLTATGFYLMLRHRTLEKFGFAIWPHLFRTSAATETVIGGIGCPQLTSSIVNHVGSRNDDRYVMELRALMQAITRTSVLRLQDRSDDYFLSDFSGPSAR